MQVTDLARAFEDAGIVEQLPDLPEPLSSKRLENILVQLLVHVLTPAEVAVHSHDEISAEESYIRPRRRHIRCHEVFPVPLGVFHRIVDGFEPFRVVKHDGGVDAHRIIVRASHS